MSLISSSRESGGTVITSGDRLTIECAADFMRLMREGLASASHVALAFEADLASDLTGLQLICSACKTAASGGKSFTFSGPRPHALLDIIDACGAQRHTACK
ncbi:MAG: hypothetical protein HXX11_23645 [Desulfuromonadales bacterium]|nr:hypothetical protein [Desulfuromonadales bacterium]